METNLLDGWNILLALWQIRCAPSFLGCQPLRKSSLNANTVKETRECSAELDYLLFVLENAVHTRML